MSMIENTSWLTYGEPFAFHLSNLGTLVSDYKHPDDSSKQNVDPLGTYDTIVRERSFEIYDNLLQRTAQIFNN